MNNDLDILSVITAFAHRWRAWLLSSILVGIGAILFSTFALTMEYRASSVVLPPAGTAGGSLAGLVGGIATASDLEVNAIDGRELITLLNTRAIRVAMIEEFDLLDRYGDETLYEALRRMRNYLLIEEEVTGGLAAMAIVSVKISAWDEDPQFAADLVNWLVDESDRRIKEVSLSKVSWDEAFLASRLDKSREDLQGAQTALEHFATETGVFALEAQLSQIAQGLADQQAVITGLEIEAEAASMRYSEEHPMRRDLELKIAAARATLQNLRTTGSGGLMPALDSLPQAQKEYFDLFLDAKIQTALVEQLTPRLEMTRLQANYDRTRLRVLQRAVSSDYKDRPKRAWIVLGISVVYQLLWFSWFLMGERVRSLQEHDPERYARIRATMRAFFRTPAS